MKVSFDKLVLAGIIGGLVAAVINTIIYFVAQNFNGGPLLVTFPQTIEPQPLPLFFVIIFSVVPGLVAGLIYAFLSRLTSKSRLIFLIIAAFVFIGFIFGPLTAASTFVVLWALELMHVGAAIPILTAILKAKGS